MANAKKLTNIIIKVLKNRGLSPTHAMISAKELRCIVIELIKKLLIQNQKLK